jgi:hypothetical protein
MYDVNYTPTVLGYKVEEKLYDKDPSLSRQAAYSWQYSCQLHAPAALYSLET